MTAVNRTITAPEVVLPEEPPAGSVVIGSDGHSWTRGGKWWNRGDTMSYASWDALMRGHAPLTVVWEPGAQPEQAAQRVHDALAASEAQFLAAEKLRKAEANLRDASKYRNDIRASNARRLLSAEDAMTAATLAHSAAHDEHMKAQR